MGSKKVFKTYSELINHLAEKGLIIDGDEANITSLLKKHSYFDLINGYKYPFKKYDGSFKNNIRINDIYALYCFDDKIRFSLLKSIMAVEIHIKSLLSYAFCEKYGYNSSEYLNVTNYNYSSNPEIQSQINKLVSILSEVLEDNGKFEYMRHQKEEYGNIPLWVLTKALTFGNISIMYSVQNSTIQAQISKEFDGVNEKNLTSFLKLLTKFRNVCAHNERLFDFETKREQISQMKIYDTFPNSYSARRNNFFAVLIVLKYLLSNEEFSILIDEIDAAIDELFNKTHQIQKQQLFKYMKLPENWKDLKTIQIL